MKAVLKNKKILLGVTGSIAVHKAVDLTRRLTEEAASVTVIMTDAAQRFISPLSFEIASRNKVYADLFTDPMSHISLTTDADLMVVAPVTANSIAKFANGIADDLLGACMLSFRGTVVLAPAMNWRMYENPVFQRNLQYLLSQGMIQVGPGKGKLACGEDALGRMAEVSEIVEEIATSLDRKDFSGRKVVVTAGPTREYLDPVRFISNRSSGKMGFALARAAMRRGAQVTLICGSTPIEPPSRAEVIRVETTSEMREAVMENLQCDVLMMAAAVADFSPGLKREEKMEKTDLVTLGLVKTPDILAEVGSLAKKPLLVGFAAETGGDIGRARRKRLEKGADIMVFNNVLSPGSGFDVDTNEVTLIEGEKTTSFPLMTKEEAADLILDRVANLFP